MAEIIGTEDDDVISGKPLESNDIDGLGGSDTLTGGALADSLDGGEGDDFLLTGGGSGNVLVGGLGSDTLIGASQELFSIATYNKLDGGEGDDRILGGLFDTLIGGDGNDTLESLEGGFGGLDIRAGGGDDLIHVNPTDCTIDGGDGVDRLMTFGLLENASISNVEILEVGSYLQTFGSLLESFEIIRSVRPDGRVGISVSEGVDIRKQLGDTSVDLNIFSSDGERHIVGDGDDSIESFGDDVWIEGRGGNDTIIGSNGDATLLGGSGDDRISSVGDRFKIDAGLGDDLVHVEARLKGAVIEGGDGYDVLAAAGSLGRARLSGLEELRVDGSITANGAQLELFDAISTNSPKGFVNIILSGSFEADLADELGSRSVNIMGAAGNDVIVSGAGDDVIDGLGGDDVAHGGSGSDRLILSAGVDQLFGDDGDDLFEVSQSASGTIDGGSDYDMLMISGRGSATLDLGFFAIENVEALALRGDPVRATAAQFEGFDSIISARPKPDAVAKLELAESGRVDLSDELLALKANVLGTDAEDAIRTGDGDDTITGFGGDDRLEGSGGADVLSGDSRTLGDVGADTLVGGAGRDTLRGGAGDDVYIVEDASDAIREFDFDGTDTVRSSGDHKLEANVENLSLSGSADIDGTGNGLANGIRGNNADNQIDGLRGADALQGGRGADVFLFTSRLGEDNIDEILDFGRGDDRIGLQSDVFVGLSAGALRERAFTDISAGEVDADDRVLYDAASGKLYFDADGSGSGERVLFAELTGAPSISWQDILIV